MNEKYPKILTVRRNPNDVAYEDLFIEIEEKLSKLELNFNNAIEKNEEVFLQSFLLQQACEAGTGANKNLLLLSYYNSLLFQKLSLEKNVGDTGEALKKTPEELQQRVDRAFFYAMLKFPYIKSNQQVNLYNGLKKIYDLYNNAGSDDITMVRKLKDQLDILFDLHNKKSSLGFFGDEQKEDSVEVVNNQTEKPSARF